MKIFPLKSYQGFTLVELLVVLAISGIVLTSIMQIFSKSQSTYNTQEEVAAMQQNVRTAKMFLERDMRMAGSGAMNLQGPNESLLPLLFENNNGASGTDRLTIIYDNPGNDDCGTLTAPATILCNEWPTLTLAGTMPKNSAEAEVEEELSDAPFSNWDSSCSCNGTVYNPNTASAKMPLLVTAPDKSRSAILILTQITNGGHGTLDKLNNHPIHYDKIASPGNADLYNFLDIPTSTHLENKVLNELPAGSTISFFNTKSMYRAVYYVATDANGMMTLCRDTGDGETVIAEDIEDFQCSFGLDDGTIINNRNLTDTEIPHVRLVTINILARSALPDSTFNGQRMALEDHAAGAADNYRRRLLTVTVKVRNFGLN